MIFISQQSVLKRRSDSDKVGEVDKVSHLPVPLSPPTSILNLCMTLTQSTKKVRRQFRLKLSLRTAMVFFIFVALFCWWIQRSETQRRQCERLSMYESRFTGWYFKDTPSPWISWLPKSVWAFRGGHYFRSVDGVYYSDGLWAEETEGAGRRERWQAVKPLIQNCREIKFLLMKLRDYHCNDLSKARSLERLEFSAVSAPDNPHLKFPKLPKLKTLIIDECYSGLLSACFDNLSASRDLRKVDVSYDGAHLMIEQIVGNLKLEHCELHSDLISDEAIEKITHLPLKKLVTTSPLSDRAAASIAKIKTLESVDLRQSKITDAGVRSIATLPNLRAISLPDCLASPAIGNLLAPAKKLESIEIGGVFVEDHIAKQLLSLPRLKAIKVMPQCLSAKALVDLSGHTLTFSDPPGWYLDEEELQKMFKEVNGSSNPELAAFITFSAALPRDLKRQLNQLNITGDEPELQNAHMLHLSRSDIDDDALAALAKFRALKILNLSSTQITDAGITEWLRTASSETTNKLWPQLESLNLRATRTKKAWIEFASQLPKFSSIDLTATDVTDQDLASIALGSFPKLESINLAETEISHKGLLNLPHLPALNFIDIQDTAIGDEAIETLLACKKVWGLRTCNTSFSYMGEQKLAKALGPFQNGKPSYHSIVEYHITEPIDPRLTKFPNRFNRFKTFVIDGPNLSFEQLGPLLQVQKIQSLTFKQCDVTVDEFVTLAASTEYELELCGKFCEASWLDAIAGRPELKCKVLHLRHENLGLEHLRALKNWKQLRRLSLSGGKWDRKTLEQLSQLPAMRNLETLRFIDTEIERDAILGLKGHPSLGFVVTPNFTLGVADCDWVFRERIGVSRLFRVGDHDFTEIFQSLPCDAGTQQLEITAKNFAADDWSNLTRLKFITSLMISEVNVDDHVIDSISQLPFLKDLRLTKVKISEDGLRRLNEIPKLRNLTFTETDFSNVDWRDALSHCKISSTSFIGCEVSSLHGSLAPITCRITGHRIRVSSSKSP